MGVQRLQLYIPRNQFDTHAHSIVSPGRRSDLRVNSYIVHDDTLVIALFILRAGDRPGAVLIVGVSNVVHDLGSVGDDVLLTKV